MGYKDLGGLARNVAKVLEDKMASRNDDHALAWYVWTRFEGVSLECGGKELMTMLYHKKLSPFESISRCRRKIQADGLFPPTEKTKMGREVTESVVREQIGMVGIADSVVPNRWEGT